MKIVHRVSMSVDEARRQAFQSVDVNLEIGFDGFQISEDDARWPAVAELVRRFGTLDIVSVAYSSAERDSAPYLCVAPTWHHGYPQPEDDFRYRRSTYDPSSACTRCGRGGRQQAPFRMRRAPVWGRQSIMQLNWVFDQYFVTPEAWKLVFRPFGIDKQAVVLHKTGAELDSVVQLQVTDAVDIDVTGLEYEVCPACGTKKYQSVKHGFEPAPICAPPAAMFRSNQWFGSGASAYQKVFASHSLYKAIVAAQVKGAEFNPCGDRSAA